ncbi:MAG TPA: acetyltransferase [Bryobacteraceae bacterium]|nr:acetyltransferase [Bryobacteraceae bacterium]
MMDKATTDINGKRLIMIGAGDLAREICGWFPNLNVGGFLDSHRRQWPEAGMPPIIGTPEDYWPEPEDIFVCSVGNPAQRLAISRKLQARGAKFATLVHDSAELSATSSVGPGTIMLPFALVDVNARVGDHCLLYFRAGVGHGATLGDGCIVLTNAVVGARCVLGEGVVISTLAFCNPGTSIGAFAQVGANSFAARDVPPYATAIGVPARILAHRAEASNAVTGEPSEQPA